MSQPNGGTGVPLVQTQAKAYGYKNYPLHAYRYKDSRPAVWGRGKEVRKTHPPGFYLFIRRKKIELADTWVRREGKYPIYGYWVKGGRATGSPLRQG
jgi:hypothetical protein